MKVGDTWIKGVANSCATTPRGTARDPPGALLTTVSVPLNVPTVVLLKPTVTLHEPPGGRFTGQLLMTVNGAAVVMLENVSTALPVWLSGTTIEIGAEPSVDEPTFTDGGIGSSAICRPGPKSWALVEA